MLHILRQYFTKSFEIFQGIAIVTVDFNCVVCGLLKTSDHQETNFNAEQTRRPFFEGRTNLTVRSVFSCVPLTALERLES